MTNRGPCLCGDPYCPSCGPAQGYSRRLPYDGPDDNEPAPSFDPPGFGERRTIKVRTECDGEWIDERDVNATNIAEDFEGRDVLTFDCPKCGKSHNSLRVG